jgi:hypothetical protein
VAKLARLSGLALTLESEMSQWIKRALGIAGTAFILSQISSSPTAAAERPGLLQVCVGSERVVTHLQRAYPEMGLTLLMGNEAERFMELYNAQPPTTDWQIDEVLITRSPGTPDFAQLGFFRNGCLVLRIVVRRGALEQLVSMLGQEV